jgi:putative nucleotidyltransferase with HDIG domain
MNAGNYIAKFRNLIIKITAAAIAPLALLVYLPGFEVNYYYIGNFDAVWKYPIRVNSASGILEAENEMKLTDVVFFMKDTTAPLNAADFIREKDYNKIKEFVIIRWKNILYRKNKSELKIWNPAFSDTTSENISLLVPDTIKEETKKLIMESKAGVQHDETNLLYLLDKNKILTRANRDDINHLVFKLLNKNSSFSYRLSVYAWSVLILFILLIYLRNFHPEIYSDDKKVVFIYFIMSVSVWGYMFFHKWNLMLYSFPFLMFPLIIFVFFNARISGMFILLQSFIHVWYFPDKLEFLSIIPFSSLAVNFAFRNMDERRKLTFAAMLYIILSSLFYVLFHLISGKGDVLKYYSTYLPFVLSGVILFLTPGVVYISERIFGMVSDFRLMELTDLRHTLLRQLSEQVPGTFHHTMQVSAMAEEGAYHLNANTLLVRVGALYHDIGKVYHPEFFIENRNAEDLFKNDLPPEKSAEIIISHVRDGIELAYAHGLPEAIIDFIRTHHGTTRVEYFFNEYKKINPDADEKKFRYPGPLPFNKETAILMLADSVEAASRSLKNPDEVSIHEMVDRVFEYKINDNQLIYSDLTFKDIQVLKKLFKKRLLKIYHKRIS